MIALELNTEYVGFEPGAPATVKDVISQPTEKVRAVNVIAEP